MRVVKQAAKKLYEQCLILRDGLPCLTAYFYNQKKWHQYAKSQFKNAAFLGRASGEAFAAHQVLVRFISNCQRFKN